MMDNVQMIRGQAAQIQMEEKNLPGNVMAPSPLVSTGTSPWQCPQLLFCRAGGSGTKLASPQGCRAVPDLMLLVLQDPSRLTGRHRQLCPGLHPHLSQFPGQPQTERMMRDRGRDAFAAQPYLCHGTCQRQMSFPKRMLQPGSVATRTWLMQSSTLGSAPAVVSARHPRAVVAQP